MLRISFDIYTKRSNVLNKETKYNLSPSNLIKVWPWLRQFLATSLILNMLHIFMRDMKMFSCLTSVKLPPKHCCTLLTLREIDTLSGSHKGEITFSTATDMKFDGIKCEADFVALIRKYRIDDHLRPELVVGESKSFGEGELIKATDLEKLKHMVKKFPGAVIVISLMRDHFTENKKKLIMKFVNWAGRLNERGKITNPVVLLTGHELFVDFLLTMIWKDLGKPHSDFTDYEHKRPLQLSPSYSGNIFRSSVVL